MKPETETAVMHDHFEKGKKDAVTCLRAMGAELAATQKTAGQGGGS